jgi:predicted ATPase
MAKMAKIKGIRIQNFRCLKDVSMGTTSENPDAEPLSPLTVVIGKNGVGKSTLFDAFGFLADTLKNGIEEACDKRGGFEKIRSQGQTGAIKFVITYKGNEDAHPLTYRICVDSDNSDRPLIRTESIFQHADESLCFLTLANGGGFALKGDEASKDGFDYHQYSVLINLLDTTKSKEMTTQELNVMAGQAGVKAAEIVKLTDNRKLGIATLGALKQHPEIAAFRQFMESWYLSYFTPDAARSLPLDGVHQYLNSRGDNLANVVKFMEREYGDKFQDILDSIAKKIPGIHKISTQKTPDGRLLLCFNDKGFQDPFYAPQMSDGTLKVFAYLLLLEAPNPPPFICIEEPENGLYHKLLEVLATEFRAHTQRENGSQLFITTHQPYFVDGLNPREVWILEKGEDGFSTIRRASDDELVNNLFEEEMPLGGLWYSGYLDKRAKPCTLKS